MMKEKIHVTVGGELFTVAIDGGMAMVNDTPHVLDAIFMGAGNASLLVDGTVSYASIVGASIHPSEHHLTLGKPFQINVDGHTYEVLVDDRRSRLLKSLERVAPSTSGSCDVVAPMPGLVAKILFEAGDMVKSGQGVLILEAMKMENEIRSPRNGRVKEIMVGPGQPVEKGQLLARLTSDEQN